MSHFRLFLYITQGVLFFAHYFLYFTAVRFFRISDARHRLALGATLAFLSVSFLLASYLSHIHDNALTRAFYFIGGFWLGLCMHLLAAAVAAWLVTGAASLAGRSPDKALIGGVLFGIAFVFSLYGVWNAFNPQVKDIRVAIKGLPDDWKGATIAQISDVHLGHVYRADYLETLVERINALKPDMVAITGDLFDGMDGELSELVGPLNGLRAPAGVYFVTGNHEGHLGVERVYNVMKATGVTVLDDEVMDLGGLQLAGVSYRGRRRAPKIPGDIIKSIPGYTPGKPTVLLYHSPTGIEQARDAGVGLQLSGHTHKGQIFPFGYITHRIYDGIDYGLHRFGDYSIYVTNGVGSWGPPMRTGNTPEIVRITLVQGQAG